MNLQKTLQALLVADDLIESVVNGEKQISIREGHRGYREDRVLIGSIESLCALKEITEVRFTRFKRLTLEELADDGFETHEEALEALREYYPKLTEDSAVTVIRWDDIAEEGEVEEGEVEESEVEEGGSDE